MLPFLVLVLLAAGGLAAIRWMPGRSVRGPLAPPSDLERQMAAWTRRHVERLAGEIGERNVWRPAALERAATYLESELARAGYEVRSEPFECRGGTVRNVVAELEGRRRGDGILLVGAHYDSVSGSPGANDNATGAAALLALAARLADARPDLTIRWVAFVNEEPPFFQSREMGSVQHAAAAADRGDRIVGMLSLETLGFYSSAPGSQRYPFPLNLLYSDRASFVGFVARLGDGVWLRRAVAAFRRSATLPSEGAAAPGWIPGVSWSDHWSFWKHGVPSLMVTDTALFRYAHYHEATDTPEKIDYDRLGRVVVGLEATIRSLAGGEASR